MFFGWFTFFFYNYFYYYYYDLGGVSETSLIGTVRVLENLLVL